METFLHWKQVCLWAVPLRGPHHSPSAKIVAGLCETAAATSAVRQLSYWGNAEIWEARWINSFRLAARWKFFRAGEAQLQLLSGPDGTIAAGTIE